MAGEVSAMGGEVESIGIAEVRSALTWWLESGVDATVQEEPRNWLKPVSPKVVKEQAADRSAEQPAHETLDEFRNWLSTSEYLPMGGRAARRVLPHGPQEA
ncbi:MAG TPA: hypothetical protein VFW35_11690, partial [Sphingomicrobium sp.]|nr:hypothetical protein [Sphingomicrobium sp.]